MREVKFRAWNADTNKMISWHDVMFEDVTIEMLFDNEFLEIMQYTGLKDANGKEIYEGDIEQAENGDKNVIVFLLKAGTYCVMPMDIYLNNDYQNEAFSQEFMYGFGYDLFFDNLTPGKYLNIIGNIYENPELLETK